ncbi:MAG: PKD domain-containing protein, partial [Planctomycetes bacterium]|nr:PKD domain-containing protein [Planctomycetota bacterium]
CIAVLDDGLIDFDDWVDAVALERVTCPDGVLATLLPPPFADFPFDEDDFAIANGVLSGIVLLPDGAHRQGDFPFAPSYYPIHTQDITDPEDTFPHDPDKPDKINWSLWVHDLVIGLDVVGEILIPNEHFQTAYAAHEYMHTWEWFPDTYDYDVYGPPGPTINCPIGNWDIMAGGGLVHPLPIFKELSCTDWIEPIDLTTILIPGVDTTLTLPPYEFVRDNSVFFLPDDPPYRGAYYFWSAGRGFDENMPGEGMLILYSDRPITGLPCPQGICGDCDTRIIAADGLDDLCNGVSCGDDGDPWPGSTNNTHFGCDSVPPAIWPIGNRCTGLEITDIVPDGAGSIELSLSWIPTTIPSMRFIQPPGGSSVPIFEDPPITLYTVHAHANDLFGATAMRVFYTDDPDDVAIDPGGANLIAALSKYIPGPLDVSVNWNIAGLPDGAYHVFAETIPGANDDGAEASATTPRSGRYDIGNGTLTVDDVDTTELITSGAIGLLPAPETFIAFDELGIPVDFSAEGVQIGDRLDAGFALAGLPAFAHPVTRTIAGISPDGLALTLSDPVELPLDPLTAFWLITRQGGGARLETWTIELVDIQTDAVQDWLVTSSLTQPRPRPDDPDQDPWPHLFTDPITGEGTYTSIGGEVTFTLTNCTPDNADEVCPDQGAPREFALGDTWVFTTTGRTAVSKPVWVVDGQISEAPIAVILAKPLTGCAPLTVTFDGSESIDPAFGDLTYEWDFGDAAMADGPEVTHTFEKPATYMVTLTVTSSASLLTGTSEIDIHVATPSPTDIDDDCDTDLDDYGLFAICFELSGPGMPPPFGECLDAFDRDFDGDVDLSDFAGFESAFTGPNG